MELPTKHHHSPAFSLVPWAGADAKVCEMRMVPGLDRKFVAQRKHPNATGFMRNLYKIDGVPEQASQHLETNFMKPLDTRASTALNLMLSDQAHDVAQRSDWDFVNDHFRRMWAKRASRDLPKSTLRGATLAVPRLYTSSSSSLCRPQPPWTRPR